VYCRADCHFSNVRGLYIESAPATLQDSVFQECGDAVVVASYGQVYAGNISWYLNHFDFDVYPTGKIYTDEDEDYFYAQCSVCYNPDYLQPQNFTLPLTAAPEGVFLKDTDAPFVALQLVRAHNNSALLLQCFPKVSKMSKHCRAPYLH
jgi:hypothetical protein